MSQEPPRRDLVVTQLTVQKGEEFIPELPTPDEVSKAIHERMQSRGLIGKPITPELLIKIQQAATDALKSMGGHGIEIDVVAKADGSIVLNKVTIEKWFVGRSYELGENPASIRCLKCGRASYNAEDITQKYCGHCHEYHTDPRGPVDPQPAPSAVDQGGGPAGV